jgi:hypothetical protein
LIEEEVANSEYLGAITPRSRTGGITPVSRDDHHTAVPCKRHCNIRQKFD